MVDDDLIPVGKVRDAVNFLKSCSQEIKKAILNNDISYKKAGEVIQQRLPLLQQLFKKTENEYNKKETIKKIIEKESYHAPDVLRLLVNFLKELEPSYIDEISDEFEKKQAISDAIICVYLLIRFNCKISELEPDLYNTVKQKVGLTPEIIEMVKEDGHNYRLPIEWKTPFEEKSKLLDGYLSKHIDSPIKNTEVIYWSYSQSQGDIWTELSKARERFRESYTQSSEPDIVVKSDKTLFFIESKIFAPNIVDFNRNHNVKEKKERIDRYSKGNLYLSQSIDYIINSGYYQLMSYWILGSWIAEKNSLDFILLNLVRRNEERNIESDFGKYINLNGKREFKRITWSDIYDFVTNNTATDKDKILSYFRNKTIYDKKGRLQKSFLI